LIENEFLLHHFSITWLKTQVNLLLKKEKKMANLTDVTNYIIERANREGSVSITKNEDFTEAGLDSLDMMGIFQDIESKYNINIKFASGIKMDTPQQVAEVVIDEIMKKEM
jgi:acyl carrier protein